MGKIKQIKEQLDSNGGFDFNIFLIGFMGVGKSTVADGLERMFGMERMEMDSMIAKEQGMTISEIFDKYGENYFRDLESGLLIELQKKSGAVVSCGGGVVLRSENTKNMKKHGRIVLLTASAQTIYERVKDSNERPILNNNMNVEYIEELMGKRRARYLEAADVVVETDGKDAEEICTELIESLLLLDKEESNK